MKLGAPDHPKTEHLAELLGIRHREAVGIIELLIHFTSRYAERGDVGRFSDSVIAKRLDWTPDDGAPEALIEGLKVSGWLDPHPVHRFVLHDWSDHAADYTKKKIKGGEGWAVDDKPPEDKEISPSPENSRKFQKIPENSGLLSYPGHARPCQSKPSDGASAPHADDPCEGYEAEKLVSLLGEKEHARKLSWLSAELPSIVTAARADLAAKGNDSPTRKAMTAKVKDRLLAFWKWQEGEGKITRLSPAQAREQRGREAARRIVENPNV